MYRSGSETRHSQAGFTLLEAAITIAVSGILIGVVTMIFRDSQKAYSLQVQLAERDQNAQYVMKRLTDRLMQAGADLPAEQWKVVRSNLMSGTGLIIGVNSRGGVQVVPAPVTGRRLPVQDGKAFAKCASVLIAYEGNRKPTEAVAVIPGGRPAVVKKGAPDTLQLATDVALQPGDVVYAFSEEAYRIENGMLKMGEMTMAENIDSLTVQFFGSEAATQDWKAMKSAKITVVARTSRKDPAYSGDGYRRSRLQLDVRMRNRM